MGADGPNQNAKVWESHGVRLPMAIEDALASDELVIFCGAGISMGSPSDLPDFKGLATLIAEPLGVAETDVPEDQLDVFLGRLDAENGNVHRRAAEIITARHEYNSMHREVVRLAELSPTVRIVTTNYDTLLERVFEEQGMSVPVYGAPALPLGDNFEGIVHLHGRLPYNDFDQFVLTDQDFGRAYITRGWATEFATSLFEQFTVLFIGYSAGDVVMRYLARSLRDTGRMYALVPEGEQDAWDMWPVVPIEYPNARGDFAALPEFLASWNDRQRLTPQQRSQEARAIAEAGPPEKAAQHRTLFALSDPRMVTYFCDFADAAKWVPWLESNGVLDCLIANAPSQPSAKPWATWIANSILRDGGDTALMFLRSHGNAPGLELWRQLFFVLANEDFTSIDRARQLVMILSANPNNELARLSLLFSRVASKDPRCAEAMLPHLLAIRPPDPIKASGFTARGSLFDVSLDPLVFIDGWRRLHPQLRDPETLVGTLIGLISAIENEADIFDELHFMAVPFSDSRAISDETLHHRYGALGLIVEMARDSIRLLVATGGPARAVGMLRRGTRTVRRLAVDALGSVAAAYAEDAVVALVASGLIMATVYRWEVVPTLRILLPQVNDECVRDAIDHIVLVEASSDGELVSDFARGQVLHLIDEGTPRIALVHEARAEFDAANPAFELAGDPTLGIHRVTGAGVVEGAAITGRFLGWSAVEVVDAIGNSPLRYDPFAPVDIPGELDVYFNEREENPLLFLRALKDTQRWSVPLWQIALSALPRMPARSWAGDLPKLVLSHPELRHLASSVSRAVLSEEVDAQVLRKLAKAVVAIWSELPEDEEPAASRSNRGISTYSPRGWLANTYMQLLAISSNRRRRRSLTQFDRANLERLIGASIGARDSSLLFVARYAGMLVLLDSDWFDQQLRQCFDLTSPEAELAWRGQIEGGSWNPSLVSRLGEQLRTGRQWFAAQAPELYGGYLEHHAYVFAFCIEASDWADALLAGASEDDREAWLRVIANYARRDASAGVAEHLLRFWRRRVTGMPIAISGGEQAVFYHWLSIESTDFEAFADCFVAGPDRFSQLARYEPYFDFDALPSDALAEAAARVVLKVVTGASETSYFAPSATARAAAVNELDPDLAGRILNALLDKGYTPAIHLLEAL